MIHPNYGKADDLTPAELRNLRAHYCAEAELVDRWVGRILQKIDDLALWDNSVVIFTTDHGMSLGENNMTGKMNINDGDDRIWPLYPAIAHIPFMIAAPGLEGGRSVNGLAQPVDILPTLIDLVGVDVEPPESFHGRSFADALRGKTEDTGNDCAVSACMLRVPKEGKIPAGATTPVLYTDNWAYAPIGPKWQRQLFAIKDDPYCEKNVAADHPDVVKKLHDRLAKWLKDVDAPAEALAVLEDDALA